MRRGRDLASFVSFTHSPTPISRLVFITFGNDVRAYVVSTGALGLVFSGHSAAISGISEHPNNAKQLLTSSLDGTLRAWDTDDAACLYTLDIGAPVTHLCAVLSSASSSTLLDRALVYIAVAQLGDAPRGDYPLGNEVACLRPRPLATAFAFTVSTTGRSRVLPKTLVLEVDLALRRPTRCLGRGQGFVVGLEGRSCAAGGRVVAFALRRRLYVWRSNPGGGVCKQFCDTDSYFPST